MARVVVLVDIDGETISIGPCAVESTIEKIRAMAEQHGTARGEARHMSVYEFTGWMKQRGGEPR